jgi:hypothetical protein
MDNSLSISSLVKVQFLGRRPGYLDVCFIKFSAPCSCHSQQRICLRQLVLFALVVC